MGKRSIAGTGISVGAILALPAAAQADDFTVTNLNASGSGSLDAAVIDANIPGADRILFKSKLSGTINLEDEALYLGSTSTAGDIEVIGPGARKVTVDGAPGYPAFVPFATFNGAPPIDVTISGLRIAGSDNDFAFFGDDGGGIQTYGEVDLTLSRVTIAGNSADGNGGGVATIPAGQPSDLTIENSTISGNSSGGEGGGINATGFYGGEISISNSTISGNQAAALGGGAIFTYVDPDSATIRNSTVIGNESGSYSGGGGLYITGLDGATLGGTIVAGNTDLDGAAPDLSSGPWFTSFSLIGDTTGATIENDGGNLLNVDPKLKPLKDNGGPTDTHAFKKSPVKNKIPKGQTPKNDQRGAKRKGKGDIGAYELVKCEGVIVNFVGTAGKDKLKGTKKKDGILGLGGNDKLSGKKGKDGLCGGQGKDKLKGGPGKDKLNGGPGKDKEIQ